MSTRSAVIVTVGVAAGALLGFYTEHHLTAAWKERMANANAAAIIRAREMEAAGLTPPSPALAGKAAGGSSSRGS